VGLGLEAERDRTGIKQSSFENEIVQKHVLHGPTRTTLAGADRPIRYCVRTPKGLQEGSG
jgi:hypothetical protein